MFGDHGLIIETVTHLEDIPNGDCFNVEDRWVVRPTTVGGAGGDDGGDAGQSLTIAITFEVVWTKGTMWKKIIETKTRADTCDFFSARTR